MKTHTTTIQFPKFTLEAEWIGEKPEKEVGFQGSFEIEKVKMYQTLKHDTVQVTDITELCMEFDTMFDYIENKVLDSFNEQIEPDKFDLFKELSGYFDINN